MYKMFVILLFFTGLGYAEHNSTTHSTVKDKSRQHKTIGTKKKRDENLSEVKKSLQKHLREQLEREKKYAKEQKFYMGKEYNLSEHQVDQAAIDAVEVIEPDYDFDITDVYRDDI